MNKLNKQEEFESSLHHLCKTRKGDSEEIHLISESLKRLKRNPDIFVGDPDGDFTYEDPILANATFVYYSYLKGKLPTLVASEKLLDIEVDGDISNYDWVDWIPTFISICKYRYDRSHEVLEEKTPNKSIMLKKDLVRIALIGDAGFNGTTQKKILGNIKRIHEEKPFDFLIHLGDVYFAGSDEEMEYNFLTPFKQVGPKVLAILGNHDLYFGGVPFLKVIKELDQPGRYFSIQNDYWCIACLDTSLPSKSFLRDEGELDEGQIIWLNNLIEANQDKKIIILSHHYIDSAWSKVSNKLKEQIKPFLPKIFSWYWGHEHNCAIYDKNVVGYNGVCIGNGVFMQKWSLPKRKNQLIWFPDEYCLCKPEKFSKAWQHGFLELQLSPLKLVETYHLESKIYERELIF